jgi:OOP family OmpA-OmpF porin
MLDLTAASRSLDVFKFQEFYFIEVIMLKKNLLVSILAVAGLMIGASASAQVYVGATAGQSKWNDECKGTTKCDTTSTGYKVFGGYNIDKNFAVEASYFSLGKISAAANVGQINAKAEVKGSGFEIAGVAKHNFTEEFGGFAKLGLARVKADANSVVPGLASFSQDTTSTQPVLGLGVTYKVSKDIALRGEFETRRAKLGNDKETVNNFSVGVQYSF